MNKVYIVGAKRSPIGKFLGSLSEVSPSDFGAQVLKDALNQSKINKDNISEVIVGNILSAGLGQGIGRQISINAAIPEHIPGYSLNMVCGSGLKSVMDAFIKVKSGFGNVIVAGGVESMSGAPYLVSGRTRQGVKMGNMELVDHMLHDSLTDAFNNYHMGVTAENIAEKQNITREEQDAFAYLSQTKAIKAQDAGKFRDEITPINIKTRKGEVTFSNDEYINRTTNLEKLANLKVAFKNDGSVTAGNASGINDGASFTILASEKEVAEQGLKPLVEIISIGQGGVSPEVMGLGTIPAIKNALDNANLKLSDIDIIELNEAFASQSIGVIQELSNSHNMTYDEILAKTNVNGGAIALGHPIGASGNRILVTLIYEMLRNKDLKHGLASLCIGGGMGTAVIVKRVD